MLYEVITNYILPLQDFKELLQEWADFLQT